jgi:Arc/MetJ-type ribon-helix-helix transcriptional regulator
VQPQDDSSDIVKELFSEYIRASVRTAMAKLYDKAQYVPRLKEEMDAFNLFMYQFKRENQD